MRGQTILMTFMALFLSSLVPVRANYSVQVGYGKLSLVDFGSIIVNKPLILDKSLIRVFMLSGLDNEQDRSVIAIQGLAHSGATDLTVRTKSGIYQLHVKLAAAEGEDLVFDKAKSRIKVFNKAFPLAHKRMTLLSSPSYVNEYVLAGDPGLISLEQVVVDDDPEFLKTFALVTNSKQGKTDVVVAAKSGVYKFTVDINRRNDSDHAGNISLYW